MAYINQEKKKHIAENVKVICKGFGVKGTLSIDNHMTLVLTISEGRIDFSISHFNMTGHRIPSVNPYHLSKHFDGEAREFLTAVHQAMMEGNHDNSDIMSDYFDVGWYVDIKIGRWNKPYRLLQS